MQQKAQSLKTGSSFLFNGQNRDLCYRAMPHLNKDVIQCKNKQLSLAVSYNIKRKKRKTSFSLPDNEKNQQWTNISFLEFFLFLSSFFFEFIFIILFSSSPLFLFFPFSFLQFFFSFVLFYSFNFSLFISPPTSSHHQTNNQKPENKKENNIKG